MKESIYHIEPSVTREPFISEANTERLGWTPTNVVYSDGKADFNGTDSRIVTDIKSNEIFRKDFSIRCKFSVRSLTANGRIADKSTGSAAADGFFFTIVSTDSRVAMRVNGGGNICFSAENSIIAGNQYDAVLVVNANNTASIYLNGVLSGDANQAINALTEITTLNNLEIGMRAGTDSQFDGVMDVYEIYDRALTPSEISAMAKNDTYRDYRDNLICDVDAFGGVLRDNTGLGVTPTLATTVKRGSYWSTQFPTSSRVTSSLTSNADFQDGFTFCFWTLSKTLTNGRLCDKSDGGTLDAGFGVITGDTGIFRFTIDAAAPRDSAAGSYKANVWQFVSITVTSAGACTWYLGDLKTPPALSGTANQTTKTVSNITTSTALVLGNRTALDRQLNGFISMARGYKGVRTLEEITRVYHATKGKVA